MEEDWPVRPYRDDSLNGGGPVGDRNRRLGNSLSALQRQRQRRRALLSKMFGERRHFDGTGKYIASFYQKAY